MVVLDRSAQRGESEVFDASSARRAIEERNCLRAEAHLPKIPVDVELRRQEEIESRKEYVTLLAKISKNRLEEYWRWLVRQSWVARYRRKRILKEARKRRL